MAKPLVNETLERVSPFRYLPRAEREQLAKHAVMQRHSRGQVIFPQDDDDFDWVYLVAKGAVEVVDLKSRPPTRINIIEEGHFFGEREVLFRIPRIMAIRAVEPSWTLKLPGGLLLDMLRHPAFAQPLGIVLRERQGIFAIFDRFNAELLRGVTRGRLDLQLLVSLYGELEPAIHQFARHPDKVDHAALAYAVRRLPQNITRIFSFLLTDELPPAFAQADSLFPSVPTEARRRAVWEVMPGKNMLLLRSGLSDLVDFVTNLCLYALEARKIRGRLQHRNVLPLLKRKIDADDLRDTATMRDFLEHELGFPKDEAQGLIDLWDMATAERLHDIMRHREFFSVEVRRQRNDYTSRKSESWTNQIAAACRDLTGSNPGDLEGRRVHIISSNTHSVLNCLTPLLASGQGELLDWARKRNHPLLEYDWASTADLAYALLREYRVEHPGYEEELNASMRDAGILRLPETASTGIEVQLIDLRQLASKQIDPGIPPVPDGCKDLLLNIDFAFGEQAEHILRNLLVLFGNSVGSVNFLGKAGAFQGKRGDVLVPSAFIKQSSDLYLPAGAVSNCLLESLARRLPGRTVHTGPMLTVPGTLLQNRMMLQFYRHVWRCVGIEMEGAFYHHQTSEAASLGIIPSDAARRFFYYVSDLPLESGATLSARLGAHEGIPPLYAITRTVLEAIFVK